MCIYVECPELCWQITIDWLWMSWWWKEVENGWKAAWSLTEKVLTACYCTLHTGKTACYCTKVHTARRKTGCCTIQRRLPVQFSDSRAQCLLAATCNALQCTKKWKWLQILQKILESVQIHKLQFAMPLHTNDLTPSPQQKGGKKYA